MEEPKNDWVMVILLRIFLQKYRFLFIEKFGNDPSSVVYGVVLGCRVK